MSSSASEPRPSANATLLEYLHACPVCGSDDLAHYCRVPSLFVEREFIAYERCRGCGTVLRNPRMPASARVEKYEDKILPDSEKQLDPKSQAHYAYMMRRIEPLLSDACGRQLLDFGCGAGGFLLEARDAGFEVTGLELNRDLARHVEEQHDVRVHRGLSSDDDFADARFDVIVSSQVFEHLLDPRGTLEDLQKHLRTPGLLLIEVPNQLDTRERLRRGALMDDSHLFYFSARSLSQMLEQAQAGFRVLRVEQGLRPYRFLPDAARRAPLAILGAAERALSGLQIRTNLSVLARLG
jgi:2-polyprenyl-3-methyl-5-hydroxy-6-metoxy-1,4-benzoquinol methylase